MEQKLLEIFKLADELDKKQNVVYADIEYTADKRKKLVISIRSKKTFKYIERCEIELANNPLIKWDSMIELFRSYVGGACNE